MSNYRAGLEEAKEKVIKYCKDACLDTRQIAIELIARFEDGKFVGYEATWNWEPDCRHILTDGVKEICIFSEPFGGCHYPDDNFKELREIQFDNKYKNDTEYKSLEELEEAYESSEDEEEKEKLGGLLDKIKASAIAVMQEEEGDYIRERLDDEVSKFLARYEE